MLFSLYPDAPPAFFLEEYIANGTGSPECVIIDIGVAWSGSTITL
jgi:hypothetical protein